MSIAQFQKDVCIHRVHCKRCRAKVSGEEWRQAEAEVFGLTDADFACPEGKGWGDEIPGWVKRATPAPSVAGGQPCAGCGGKSLVNLTAATPAALAEMNAELAGGYSADAPTIIPPAPVATTDLVIWTDLCPGDNVVLSSVVRAIHQQHPGRFRTAIGTQHRECWLNNPYVVPESSLTNPRRVKAEWRAERTNETRKHLSQVWADDLAFKLGVPIRMDDPRGQIVLTDEERRSRPPGFPQGPYWIVMAGGKADCEVKIYPHERWQEVVDALKGTIQFVQCGHLGGNNVHRPLNGPINLLGKTSQREFIRGVYHSVGVVCPITFAMHVSAALPLPSGGVRPCVALAGGREPVSLIQYPGHTVLSAVGRIGCAKDRSCWKDWITRSPGYGVRCVAHDGKYANCWQTIPPGEVVAAIRSCL